MGLENVEGLILDLDGVLFQGAEAIGDLKKSFDTLEKLKIPFVIATNNSSRNAQHCVDMMARYNVHIAQTQVINSAAVTVHFLTKQYGESADIFVVGSDALKETLSCNGFTVVDADKASVDAVVVGIDRQFNYDKLKAASLYIQRGARFLATNDDKTVKTDEGLAPASGAIVAAIEAASSQKALVMGKPHLPMYEFALQQLGTQAEVTLMVGDQLETDIKGAQATNCLTALVLSGVSSEQQAQEWQPNIHLLARDFNEVVDHLVTLLT